MIERKGNIPNLGFGQLAGPNPDANASVGPHPGETDEQIAARVQAADDRVAADLARWATES